MNMKHLTKQKQAEPVRTEIIWVMTSKDTRAGLSKPSGVHMMPTHDLDTRQEAVRLNVCFARKQSCSGVILFYSPIPPV